MILKCKLFLINLFVFECFYTLMMKCFYHVFQGPTGDQHIAEWATLGKYIEINK